MAWLEEVETALFANSFWTEDASLEITVGIIILLAIQGPTTEGGSLLGTTDLVSLFSIV